MTCWFMFHNNSKQRLSYFTVKIHAKSLVNSGYHVFYESADSFQKIYFHCWGVKIDFHVRLAYLQRDLNSSDRHSRVYVNADKFEKSDI